MNRRQQRRPSGGNDLRNVQIFAEDFAELIPWIELHTWNNRIQVYQQNILLIVFESSSIFWLANGRSTSTTFPISILWSVSCFVIFSIKWRAKWSSPNSVEQNKKGKYFNWYDGILFETTRSSLQKLFLFNYLYEIHSLAQLTRLFFRMFAMMSKPSPNRWDPLVTK